MDYVKVRIALFSWRMELIGYKQGDHCLSFRYDTKYNMTLAIY